MKKKNDTFSISQASEITGVSKNRIREWHDKGYLPPVQWISVGSRRHRRFTEEALKMIQKTNRYLKQGYVLKAAAMKSQRNTGNEEGKEVLLHGNEMETAKAG
jgi:DNA-binding transcriptional MerR regulator